MTIPCFLRKFANSGKKRFHWKRVDALLPPNSFLIFSDLLLLISKQEEVSGIASNDTDWFGRGSFKEESCFAMKVQREKKKRKVIHRRPSGITTLSLFEFLGASSYLGLLFFTTAASRDFIALSIGAALGFLVVYGLWTLQYWAFWFTAVYESMQIVYELFLLTQPEYRNTHLVAPLFAMLLSAMTLGYIFLDRSVKPAFHRDISS